MTERLRAPHPVLHTASVKAAGLVARFAHGMHVTGQENLEKAQAQGRSFILGPNHRSFWDPPFLSAAVDSVLPSAQIHYMASNHLLQGSKHDYRRQLFARLEPHYWPAVVNYLEAVGTFWIDRNQSNIEPQTLEHLEQVVADNGILAIFPEGTRNRDQADKRIVERKKVKAGVGAIAVTYGLDIVPVGIAGAEASGRKHVHVHFGEMISVEPQEVDLSSAKSIVATTRVVRPLLHEGMSTALATAYAERDQFIG